MANRQGLCCFNMAAAAPPPSRTAAVTTYRWDVSEQLIKDAGMWREYEPLMRADFALFDEYTFLRGAAPGGNKPLPVPLHAFWAMQDRKVRHK